MNPLFSRLSSPPGGEILPRKTLSCLHVLDITLSAFVIVDILARFAR